jgi:predicted O-linked N-acetylglucosamine transferase (SPINDLY family)
MQQKLNEIFKTCKEYYDNKNYLKALELGLQLVKSNVSNEYLYQMITNIYYLNKNYDNAIKFSELTISKYYSQENDNNLYVILNSIIDDKDYDLSKEYYKNHIIKMINNNNDKTNELLKKYIDSEINNYQNYEDIKKLYQNNKISRDIFIDSVFYMIFNKHIFNETNEQLLEVFIKDESNDLDIFDKMNSLDNYLIFAIYLFYLTSPKILNVNNEENELNYNKIINNIDQLNDKCTFKFESVDVLYSSLPIYYFYYLVYTGFNNKVLYQKTSNLFKKLCPDLVYTSKNLENKNTNIKIGFISNFIFKNHSVCKDRIGIIKALIDDDRFDVYLFGNNNDSEEIYLEKIGNYKNRIILTKNIKESKKIIESFNLDILVYPEIGMDFFYWILAHSRLARTQINTWGHSETSGIDTIDYYVSSSYYEDENAQNNYSEKLIRLKSLCTYYYPLIPVIKLDRESNLLNFNLPTNCNLYGIFQNAFKYQINNIEMIKQILERDPKAIIVILGLNNNPNRFKKFLEESLGYQINRVRLFDWLLTPKYHKLLSCIDIILDSYPFGGCNTSLDAFSFNKIVITLPSDKINGRFTLGFYKKMEIYEPIAIDVDDYVYKAVKFANDIKLREQIENKINNKKYLLFEEKESIETWKEMLINLSS